MSEPLMRMLADLPWAEPDPGRAERTRMRSRAQLARQARRAVGAPPVHPRVRPALIWQPLIAVLGIAYLTEVIVQALRVYGE